MIFRMILVFAAVWMMLNKVEAQQKTHNFSARVIDIPNNDHILEPQIAIGDTATGSFTFDLTADEVDQSFPDQVHYRFSMLPNGISLNINGFTIQTNPTESEKLLAIVRQNDPTLNRPNGYKTLTFLTGRPTQDIHPSDDLETHHIEIYLLDSTLPLYEGFGLPIGALNTEDFEGARLYFSGEFEGENFEIDFEILSFEAVSQPAQTPAGTDVVVEPVDAITGQSPVSFDFQEVTVAGGTTVTTSEEGEPPTGFKLGSPATIYELETTAEFNGSVELCFDYSGVSYGDESGLKLFHFENGSWIDVTTSLDTENDIICGQVTSFSPFAIVEPDNAPPTAVAGPNQSIRTGDSVIVDGSASFDDNTAQAMLDYDWSFFSKPGTSNTTLDDSTSVMPSFVVDVAGTYILQLIVTDDEVAASDPSYVEISSDNLAPTAVATVQSSLDVIDNPVQFDGTDSSDPEMDELTYSWSITAAPATSTAVLVDAGTATPTLTPDVEGVYLVTLTVSDFIGPGAPAPVELTATTASGFAEIVVLDACDQVSVLTAGQVTTKGNQNAFCKHLANAIQDLQEGLVDDAIDKLNKAIGRTDGCPLRGSPDGNGSGRDWITDCSAQTAIYDLLNLAVETLEN